MNVKEVAALSGVSVRTLQYYDEMGLLCPSRNPDNDYREYSEEDLELLQQILFFRSCGFKLRQISKIISAPDFDPQEALLLQKKALLHEKARIEQMLETLEKTIQEKRGDITMENKERFEGFDFTKNPYEEEARSRWGDEAVDRSKSFFAKMTPDQHKHLSKDMEELFRELAKVSDQDPAGKEAQEEIQKMYDFFNSRFGYRYSYEAFAGLGRMYVEDERFTKNIDQYKPGLSAFLSKAMAVFSDNKVKLEK